MSDAKREALEAVRAAILEANPGVVTDTLWMPERMSKNETVVDYIDNALTATSPPADAARVKPLEWIEREGVAGTFDASTSIGHYIASITDDGRGHWFIVGLTTSNYTIANIGAVKRGAQKDYERRVLSALAKPADAGNDSAEARWQPIETAPKDGTRVLLFVCTRGSLRRGWPEICRWGVHQHHGESWLCHGDKEIVGPGVATHWKPIGEPTAGGDDLQKYLSQPTCRCFDEKSRELCLDKERCRPIAQAQAGGDGAKKSEGRPDRDCSDTSRPNCEPERRPSDPTADVKCEREDQVICHKCGAWPDQECAVTVESEIFGSDPTADRRGDRGVDYRPDVSRQLGAIDQ